LDSILCTQFEKSEDLVGVGVGLNTQTSLLVSSVSLTMFSSQF